MGKISLKNNGLPMFAYPESDLNGKGAIMMDSFYFNSAFEVDGKILGIQWHQQTNVLPNGKSVSVEFDVMDGNERTYSPHAGVYPFGNEAGADKDKFRVFSPLGTVEGDSKRMTAELKDGNTSMSLVFENESQVLYNGTMGMIRFLGTDSYEFAYPNMNVSGKVVYNGKKYIIKNKKAWFDRQWSFEPNGIESVVAVPGMAKLSWLWMGVNLCDDGSESISLWDAYGAKGRNCFATIAYKNGTNINYLMDVEYSGLWTSEKTGNTYPAAVKISVPEADLFMTCTKMIDDPEAASDFVSGCQGLVKVEGKYKGRDFTRYAVQEIVGNLCGE